jgi:hypothetical protein
MNMAYGFQIPLVLKTYKYPSSERLIASLSKHVIDPAETMHRRSKERRSLHFQSFLSRFRE